MLNEKKLNIDGGKKSVYVSALRAAAASMAPYMARIYIETAAQTEREKSDRILLTQAQVNISKSALILYLANNPSPLAQDMLDQLTMTRAQYAEIHRI